MSQCSSCKSGGSTFSISVSVIGTSAGENNVPTTPLSADTRWHSREWDARRVRYSWMISRLSRVIRSKRSGSKIDARGSPGTSSFTTAARAMFTPARCARDDPRVPPASAPRARPHALCAATCFAGRGSAAAADPLKRYVMDGCSANADGNQAALRPCSLQELSGVPRGLLKARVHLQATPAPSRKCGYSACWLLRDLLNARWATNSRCRRGLIGQAQICRSPAPPGAVSFGGAR